MYGDYINYDHLPAKSTYKENLYGKTCNGGSSGEKLPTVAIMAIDHKGPVWSDCTTSRSISSDNSRKTVQKMTTYNENNQYGRSILENMDCIRWAALKYKMETSFTDYYWGFQNLIYLHHEQKTINLNERDVLLDWLDRAYAKPSSGDGIFDEFDRKLEEADDDLVPKFC